MLIILGHLWHSNFCPFYITTIMAIIIIVKIIQISQEHKQLPCNKKCWVSYCLWTNSHICHTKLLRKINTKFISLMVA